MGPRAGLDWQKILSPPGFDPGPSISSVAIPRLEALIRRCDDLPATITHVPVAAVLVLNTPDDGRLRPKHVQ